MRTPNNQRMARRDFLKTAATVAAGITIVRPQAVRGSEANSTIELGIVGSGGRGVWLGDLFNKNSNIKVVALADPFADRLKNGQEKLGVAADRCYKGLNGYKELIASGVDAVAIESPPYFHPEQTMAVVDAGKHVYLAKPVAVDVPGCKTIVAAGEKAKGKVCFLVDFQTRADAVFQEAFQRIVAGDIGAPVCGEAFYHCSRLGNDSLKPTTNDADRLRYWVFDKKLSGDIIVEQNVHSLDVANWFLRGNPVKAFGTGGRKARTNIGDCWDHFICTFWYPDDVLIDFNSTQFLKGYAYQMRHDICARIFGTRGTVDSHYAGRVAITGEKEWDGGVNEGLYGSGAIENIKTFEKDIRAGNNKANNAVESTNSSLTTILGRMAAYEQRIVTWDEMMKSTERFEVELKLDEDKT
ncbi:MAG: Gfo/Idh/MocA family oxidoreductase [Phycisphaerae bacterium]|nr:Gfo/Idh/MocA family oxidoreductase [Phycisphaerae bacterium]